MHSPQGSLSPLSDRTPRTSRLEVRNLSGREGSELGR